MVDFFLGIQPLSNNISGGGVFLFAEHIGKAQCFADIVKIVMRIASLWLAKCDVSINIKKGV